MRRKSRVGVVRGGGRGRRGRVVGAGVSVYVGGASAGVAVENATDFDIVAGGWLVDGSGRSSDDGWRQTINCEAAPAVMATGRCQSIETLV